MRPILIIEDDSTIRETLVEILELEGFQPIAAKNGREGLIAMRTHQPWLVILDLMMPVMNGWDFLEAKKLVPEMAETPVIVMSAGANEPVRGTVGFLRKPFSIEDLLRIAMRHAPKVEERIAC